MPNDENLTLSKPKIILPGEYGFSFDGTPIGTFAVGAEKGCRGYLIFDQITGDAGVAHVDFFNQDTIAISVLYSQLKRRGRTNIVIGKTANSSLNLEYDYPTITLPSPEFIFHPQTNKIISSVPQKEKKRIFEARLEGLKARLRTKTRDLMEV